MSTSHMSTMVGTILHSIRGLVAPQPILMLCEFPPVPLFSFLPASPCCIGDHAYLKHRGELVHVGGLWWDFLSFCGSFTLSLRSFARILMTWGILMRERERERSIMVVNVGFVNDHVSTC